MWILILLLFIILGYVVRYLNKDYFILSMCKRFKTIDGSKLEEKVCIIPGKTVFGNNFDMLKMNPESVFKFCRDANSYSKGKSYVLHFLVSGIYNVCTAEDAEEVFQSQSLITKSSLYDLLQPFLGEGLLTSTDQKWHFRRKILTPAFHFNILQTFLEIFKEESYKFVKTLNEKVDESEVALVDVIPQFTLNNVCETALGVKLDNIEGSDEYRQSIHNIEVVIVERTCNPLFYFKPIFYFYGDYKKQRDNLKIAHEFSSKIIEKKREEFLRRRETSTEDTSDDFGKKKRYAMLDTLLDAETKGQIDHQGICDEVNTFMFEGYDTTSTCLIFALLNLSLRRDIQDKCYEEIQQLANMADLTVFDFNQLEYLECVIKETLRLYPSVPFLGRKVVTETNINGIILPPLTLIHVHTFDIMRNAKDFPDPLTFDPDRFLPKNTTNRHPFAFIPFSAGPRNCIGQKFAILEMKVLLVSVIKNFLLKPVTRLEDIIFENGLVLRTQQQVKIQLQKRHS